MSPARVVAIAALSVIAVLPAAAPAVAKTHKAKTAFVARGSIGQAYVTGARHGERLILLRHGRRVAAGSADRLGSRVFRGLTPGRGYTVRHSGRTSTPFAVLSRNSNPPAAYYHHIKLHAGLNYVRMRDGIELAMTVRLPTGKKLSDGPFPTFIEYSGYQVAAPHDLLGSIVASLSGKSTKPDPLAPDTATAVGSVLGPLLGFATVSVQMRGSGCSGGAFDLFDLPTTYDGYDAVESVAAQKWVKGGKVGMAGISFSGITQLFTAGTQPPHLAAIAPMSVTDDIYTATGYPGGIFNRGFALSWITERMHDARPAPAGGQPYARILAKKDRHCRSNQRLRLQTQNALDLVRDNPYRTPALFADRAPGAWVKHITVPTFAVGSMQDEQTGGHFAESLADLRGNPRAWITLQNGVHVDSLAPDVITRWFEFMKIYVAHEVPKVPDSVLGLSGALYQFLADSGAEKVQQSRFADMTDFAAVQAAFEQDPRVRVLMDNGGGPDGPGSIGSPWELTFGAWPPAEVTPGTWYLGDGGALASAVPASAASASYTADPKARPDETLGGTGQADAWKAQPPYDWAPLADGKGVGFVTPALPSDVVIAGPSSLDLYLSSSAKDTDLQVTLSEVRPDGNETYVQNGWLRASHRKLDAARSTALDPFPTHLAQDAAPLPAGQSVLVRVPIFPVVHAFRAGSRIRVTVEAPGGDRPRWSFATVDDGTAHNTISLGGATPSKLVLPVVAGADAKGTPLPGPTALRGEPSRVYKAAANGG